MSKLLLVEDDVFVIVVFTALASTGTISAVSFLQIPVSIVLVGATVDLKYAVTAGAFNTHHCTVWLNLYR